MMMKMMMAGRRAAWLETRVVALPVVVRSLSKEAAVGPRHHRHLALLDHIGKGGRVVVELDSGTFADEVIAAMKKGSKIEALTVATAAHPAVPVGRVAHFGKKLVHIVEALKGHMKLRAVALTDEAELADLDEARATALGAALGRLPFLASLELAPCDAAMLERVVSGLEGHPTLRRLELRGFADPPSGLEAERLGASLRAIPHLDPPEVAWCGLVGGVALNLAAGHPHLRTIAAKAPP